MSNANCKPRTRRSKPESRLEQKLLSIDGTRVCCLGRDPHVSQILSRGQLFTNRVRLRRGEPNDCHANAAKLWAQDIDKVRLVTGYALVTHESLKDGIWVSHSWVIRGKTLYETTTRFDRYFGVVLDRLEAVDFWIGNVLKTEFPDMKPTAEFMEQKAVPLSMVKESVNDA